MQFLVVCKQGLCLFSFGYYKQIFVKSSKQSDQRRKHYFPTLVDLLSFLKCFCDKINRHICLKQTVVMALVGKRIGITISIDSIFVVHCNCHETTFYFTTNVTPTRLLNSKNFEQFKFQY